MGDKKVLAYTTGDTMVRRDYRDGLTFLELVRNLTRYMRVEGYSFSFGFPNDHSYPVFKKAKLAKDIGRLDTYFLPIRIGGIKKGLAWLNPLSWLFCRGWVMCSGLCLRREKFNAYLHKDDESYNSSRYKRMDGNYSHVVIATSEFYYKIQEHEGVRAAFLIDVVGKSELSFHSAVKYLLDNEHGRFDIILYLGHLPKQIRRVGLIKVPRRIEPKHLYMTGWIIDKEGVEEQRFCDIDNWDVNLSDYDIV